MTDYVVTIAAGALDNVGTIARNAAPAHRYALISDTNVAPRYASRVAASFGGDRIDVFLVPPGEVNKTRDSWAHLTDAMLADGCGRDTVIIALGGGVVGDLAGFVAATYMRGIPYVQVPTSLLAMIDASIGGKTGVDTHAGKNLVGAFHQPSAVIADPETLRTLPQPHLRAGLAEAIKHGVIADVTYFERLVATVSHPLRDGDEVGELIARSIAIKQGIVGRDERERGMRKVLNFGHTIGHAIESESGYRLLHGEAVAIGMILESRLAERAGVAEPGTAARVVDAIDRARLPVDRPRDLATDRIIAAMRADKKSRAGQTEFVLPRRIGSMAGEESGWGISVPEALVREVLA
ncbi:MAG: 3-dehydroquinate synthase [Gemmatimonadota bacterium]|nr:3-dehydroquinate synthase [Gemmatimonadota bacterium]